MLSNPANHEIAYSGPLIQKLYRILENKRPIGQPCEILVKFALYVVNSIVVSSTRAMLCVLYAMALCLSVCLSVCVCVCLSVTPSLWMVTSTHILPKLVTHLASCNDGSGVNTVSHYLSRSLCTKQSSCPRCFMAVNPGCCTGAQFVSWTRST